MRIKRTFAATMREALQIVKQEQGADAVILGNKKVPGGVELISAIDFDQQTFDSSQSEADLNPVALNSVSSVSQNIDSSRSPERSSNLWPDTFEAQTFGGRTEPVLGPVAAKPEKQVSKKPSQPDWLTRELAQNPDQIRLRQTSIANSQKAAPALKRSGELSQEEKAKRIEEKISKLDNQKRSAPKSADKRAAKKSPAKPVRKSSSQSQQTVAKKAAVKKSPPPSDNRSVDLPPNPVVDQQPVITEVKNELQNLRDLMESQLSVMQWDQFNQRHPVRSVLLNLMSELGLGSDVCETVLSHLKDLSSDPHKVWQQAIGLLARFLPTPQHDILAEGGRIALVGSTGVGKTTTIAKLAARFAHVHGKRSVAMISTDQFRIGAQEQLQHFARLLEIPLLLAGNREELSDRLEMLNDKKLVLIDTAGMSQRDVRLSEQFHQLQRGAPEIQPYLVISANTQLAALNQTVMGFDKVSLAGAIVTKLDEAASLGGVITTSIRHNLALHYCATGQRVPEDLETARNHRVISKAVTLMQQYSESTDPESLATRYTRIINHNLAR